MRLRPQADRSKAKQRQLNRPAQNLTHLLSLTPLPTTPSLLHGPVNLPRSTPATLDPRPSNPSPPALAPTLAPTLKQDLRCTLGLALSIHRV
jgi:hypothetical protein